RNRFIIRGLPGRALNPPGYQFSTTNPFTYRSHTQKDPDNNWSSPGGSPKRKSGWPDSQSLVVGWRPIVELKPVGNSEGCEVDENQVRHRACDPRAADRSWRGFVRYFTRPFPRRHI